TYGVAVLLVCSSLLRLAPTPTPFPYRRSSDLPAGPGADASQRRGAAQRTARIPRRRGPRPDRGRGPVRALAEGRRRLADPGPRRAGTRVRARRRGPTAGAGRAAGAGPGRDEVGRAPARLDPVRRAGGGDRGDLPRRRLRGMPPGGPALVRGGGVRGAGQQGR